ncbi:ATP-dependent RNA helicase DHX36 [Larimichthys crocea]|uniref:Uncharacterized protein n=1 Tax=Larimichthys crocea TaxID=215358 RepID=A0ACD3QKU2_LARCR|nr:ATP-dependent RNA helicase DHX36 [Larimichthys crocea]
MDTAAEVEGEAEEEVEEVEEGTGMGAERDGTEEGGGGGGGSRGHSSDFDQDGGEGGGGGGGGGHRDRPPPHLKGREIGLWYARYGAVRRKQADRRSRAVVQMDEAREQHITKLLNSVQNDQPGPQRNSWDARASTSGNWQAAANRGGHCFFDGDEPEEDKLKVEVKSEEEEEEEMGPKKATQKSQRYFSSAVVKDEPPDTWDDDEEEQQQEEDKEEKEDKEKLRRKDKDLEFLFQEVVRDSSLDERLKRELASKKSDTKYKEMLKFREKTTVIWEKREAWARCAAVVCTQPRRISAISVAERVAAERAESVGNGNSCGYQIRLQSRLPRRQGSVLYCTTGIILQWLRSDPLLSSISHLVLDEIHERNLQSDVLLIIVKELLNLRDDLSVILMSATLNAEKFSRYFDNCPVINIPGLTFPVEEFLLEDIVEMTRYRPQNQDRRPTWKRGFWQGRNARPEKEEKEAEYKESWPCYARTLQGRYSDNTIQTLEMLDNDDKIDLELILALIRHIVLSEEEGAILVFLPGWDNISSLNDLLMAQQMFRSERFVIIPLHSLMPTVNQTQVFKRPPPGVRKIVIATNIAETSITIDDVVFVIDGGKIKETNFDTNNNISTMMAEWVSLANAKQRKGRAGRVCPGKCYHLYNGLRASLLDAYQLPEIMRTPLEELCLQIKILKLGSIARFLEKALDPPTEQAVNLAIKNLTDLNALDRVENLTALGFHLARLPVEPHIGKLILFGALLGCLDPVLTIAASLSFKDPFFIPLGKEKMADMRRKHLSRNSKSDHLTIVNAFQGWEEAKQRGGRCEREYCWDNFLSANTLQMLQNMKGQFAEHLMHAGFVSSKDPKDPKSNVNSGN